MSDYFRPPGAAAGPKHVEKHPISWRSPLGWPMTKNEKNVPNGSGFTGCKEVYMASVSKNSNTHDVISDVVMIIGCGAMTSRWVVYILERSIHVDVYWMLLFLETTHCTCDVLTPRDLSNWLTFLIESIRYISISSFFLSIRFILCLFFTSLCLSVGPRR